MSEKIRSSAEYMEHLNKLPDSERKNILIEMEQCRHRLAELRKLLGTADSPSREHPRVLIPLSPEHFHHLHTLAYRSSKSVAYLGQLAILRLLLDADDGKVPLLPEYRLGVDPGHA